jgi:hypothetical protein
MKVFPSLVRREVSLVTVLLVKVSRVKESLVMVSQVKESRVME